MKIIILLLCMVPGPALAKHWIELHLASWHSEPVYYEKKQNTSSIIYTEPEVHEFNGRNYGLGIMFEVNDYLEAGVGWFINSYNDTAGYAGVDIHTRPFYGVRAGVSVAPVTGYEETPLLVWPNLTAGNSYARVKVGVAPAFDGGALLTLSVGVAF